MRDVVDAYMPPVTKRFFIAIVAMFVLQALLTKVAPAVVGALALSPQGVFRHFFLWEFVTYGFLHGGLSHLIFNLIGVFFFSGLVERAMGGRRFTMLILAAIVAGGVAHATVFAFLGGWGTGLVGFSAANFALLAACCVIAPNARVYLYGTIPMTMKWLVILYVGFEVLQVLQNGVDTAISHIAHLAGAATGFLFVKKPHLLDRIRPGRRRGPRVVRRKSRPLSMGHPGRSANADDRYDDPHWRLDQ